MSKTTIHAHKHWIPKLYLEPCMFALSLYHKSNQFNASVDAAYNAYRNKIKRLDRNVISYHLGKYILNS